MMNFPWLRPPGRLRMAASLAASLAAGHPATAAPPARDLLEVIRTNLAGLPSGEFESRASAALLGAFQARLQAPGEGHPPEDATPAITDRRVLPGPCLLVRLGQATLGLAPQLAAVLADTNLTHGALGLVLDLRFASGTDYPAAAQVADLFMAGETELLRWGDQTVRSRAKKPAWDRPVLVLVNGRTRGTAEALAAMLRAQGIALVVGGTTAGEAAVFREIPLPSGEILRLAAGPVHCGELTLDHRGLRPDLEVRVPPEQELAYLADPFTPVRGRTGPESAAGTGTNTVVGSVRVRRRVNEAELVRSRQGGDAAETRPPTPDPAPAPVLQDPVLARAVDLLKAMALLPAQKP